MSQPVTKPCFLSQTPRSSGDVFTGEIQFVRGGGRGACIWSGALLPNLTATPSGSLASGGHVILYAGAGRLNHAFPQVLMTSGLPVFFYDAGAIAPSGTSVSGQKLIGILPPTFAGAQSGNPTSINPGVPISYDFPFNSGLCAAVPSGTPGFSVSFTPEVSAAFPNP